ncbi:uncharacterized protein Dwil_GK11976 [Drosophila willistoni]|uniref:Arb2 domain-containing protein n=1 Tax=Drosophila willistoni TaxID=7260 RepID=B4N823_DROWI|nr:FAM172 family protein homolog CG10038 [Drosophila willistoni]EDW81274.1 uncharacterized protein Dwil_GK11976 [Drosophila willistoni]
MADAPAKNREEAIQKLKDLGYGFNTDGCLRKIDSHTGEVGDEPFVYAISENITENEKHYEKLANQIPEIIYSLLEQQGLERTYIPFNEPLDRSTFIFTQPAKLSRSKKLLILIHGSGYVRAGQWARSLIINNSLDHGSQLPYVRRGQELGYDILVTNTNDGDRLIKGKYKPIKGVETPIKHATYVWEHIVMPSNPESVAIVAHSYGGSVTTDLAEKFTDFFKEKVFGIALTDSVSGSLQPKSRPYLLEVSRNWCSSSEPLDTELKSIPNFPSRVSAGHGKHEWTSYSAFESVFKFLEDKYEKRQQST